MASHGVSAERCVQPNGYWLMTPHVGTADGVKDCVIGFVAAAFAALLPICQAQAHCFIGIRFLPATLNVDDPCVADEMSLPTLVWSRTGDVPAASEVDLSADLSKRITEDLGITIGSDWTRLTAPGGVHASGFQNLGTSLQYQLLKDPQRELAVLASLGVDWGGTGAKALASNSFSTITPALLFGKGMGDFPDSLRWIRPLALTGVVGYSDPTRASNRTADPTSGIVSVYPNPRFLVYGTTLQYSVPYLTSSVVDLGLPAFLNHLIPIVEAQFMTPVANYAGTATRTTGSIDPGAIWVGNYYQVGLEAIVPINRDSGTGVGIMVQFHLYLDDLFPTTIGRPLFGAGTAAGIPTFGN